MNDNMIPSDMPMNVRLLKIELYRQTGKRSRCFFRIFFPISILIIVLCISVYIADLPIKKSHATIEYQNDYKETFKNDQQIVDFELTTAYNVEHDIIIFKKDPDITDLREVEDYPDTSSRKNEVNHDDCVLKDESQPVTRRHFFRIFFPIMIFNIGLCIGACISAYIYYMPTKKSHATIKYQNECNETFKDHQQIVDLELTAAYNVDHDTIILEEDEVHPDIIDFREVEDYPKDTSSRKSEVNHVVSILRNEDEPVMTSFREDKSQHDTELAKNDF